MATRRYVTERDEPAPRAGSGIAAYAAPVAAPASITPTGNTYLDQLLSGAFGPSGEARLQELASEAGLTPTDTALLQQRYANSVDFADQDRQLRAIDPKILQKAGYDGPIMTEHRDQDGSVTFTVAPELKKFAEDRGLIAGYTGVSGTGGALKGESDWASALYDRKTGARVTEPTIDKGQSLFEFASPILMAVGANYLLPAAGGAGAAAPSAAELVAADATGGLVPEFGTHAAYEAGLAGAGSGGVGAYGSLGAATEPVASIGQMAPYETLGAATEPVASMAEFAPADMISPAPAGSAYESLGAATEPVASMAPAVSGVGAAAPGTSILSKLGEWAMANPMQAFQLASTVAGGIKNLFGGNEGGGGASMPSQAGFTANQPPALNRTVVAPPAGYRPGFDPEWNYFREGA